MLIHASCIAIDRRAVLLTGKAGAGKSDLALRLIDEGAALIADDQTLLTRVGDVLMASAPESIKGLIEMRHVGLLRMPHGEPTPVALAIELANLEGTIERLPDEDFTTFMDIRIRHLRLPAFAASTPAKIRAVLKYPEAK